jgi:hypothetical protein
MLDRLGIPDTLKCDGVLGTVKAKPSHEATVVKGSNLSYCAVFAPLHLALPLIEARLGTCLPFRTMRLHRPSVVKGSNLSYCAVFAPLHLALPLIEARLGTCLPFRTMRLHRPSVA